MLDAKDMAEAIITHDTPLLVRTSARSDRRFSLLGHLMPPSSRRHLSHREFAGESESAVACRCREIHEHVHHALDQLAPQERWLICCTDGIGGPAHKTIDLADELGVSRQEILTRRRFILRNLRQILTAMQGGTHEAD